MPSFDELLKKDKTMLIHHRNIHFIAIEMYKIEMYKIKMIYALHLSEPF